MHLGRHIDSCNEHAAFFFGTVTCNIAGSVGNPYSRPSRPRCILTMQKKKEVVARTDNL